MKHILAHATESPQEAEELGERLRAKGIEVDVRRTGGDALGGVLEAAPQAWELWIPEAGETAAKEIVVAAKAEFDAQSKELEKDLEAEALAAPGAETPPPESKPKAPITQNARIAGALFIAHTFVLLATFIVDAVRADPVPFQGGLYLSWIVQVVIAMALWNGSRGARMMGVLWTAVTGVYYTLGYLDRPLLSPILEGTFAVSLLTLLLTPDKKALRYLGVGLWSLATLVSIFPMTLAPGRLTDDHLVGYWRRTHTQEQIAFCADGRYFTGYPVFSTGGKWQRAGYYDLILAVGTKTERHLYAARLDHLSLFQKGWDRIVPDLDPCKP